MKVILREDVQDLGQAGQTVQVRDGYGRNYLIPRNLAIPATKGNLSAVDEIKRQKDVRDRKRKREAEVVKDRLQKLQLTAEVLVGEEDKLFGSVTSADIADLIEREGVSIDKRSITLDEPIKALGMYSVPVKVDKDVVANVQLLVRKKAGS